MTFITPEAYDALQLYDHAWAERMGRPLPPAAYFGPGAALRRWFCLKDGQS